jgi:hypothetical protein
VGLKTEPSGGVRCALLNHIAAGIDFVSQQQIDLRAQTCIVRAR